jgi:hypothetical protein
MYPFLKDASVCPCAYGGGGVFWLLGRGSEDLPICFFLPTEDLPKSFRLFLSTKYIRWKSHVIQNGDRRPCSDGTPLNNIKIGTH